MSRTRKSVKWLEWHDQTDGDALRAAKVTSRQPEHKLEPIDDARLLLEDRASE